MAASCDYQKEILVAVGIGMQMGKTSVQTRRSGPECIQELRSGEDFFSFFPFQEILKIRLGSSYQLVAGSPRIRPGAVLGT